MITFTEGLLLIITALLGASVLVFVIKNPRGLTRNKQPKPQKSAGFDADSLTKEVITENIRSLQESYQAQLKQKSDEIMSLRNSNNKLKSRIKQLEALEEEEQDEDTEESNKLEALYDVDWIKAAQVGAQLGLDMKNFNPNDPILTNVIKEKIFENSDIAILMGVLKPKGNNVTGLPQPLAPIPASPKSPIDAFIEDAQKNGYIA